MNYDKEKELGYTLMNDVDYSVYFQPFHRDLPFFTKKA